MHWAQELASSLQPNLDSVNRLASRFEASLSEAERSEDLHDLLRAGSILLRAGALKGELILPRLDHAPSGLQEPNAPSSSTAVLGLGVAGRETLSAFLPAGDGQGRIARFLFDLEASRACELDASIIGVVLQLPFPDPRDSGGGSGVPRYPEMLRAAYRGAAGPKGLPRILSESLFEPGSRRTMVHVVADIEDPWVVLLPELLSDLRAFFGFGARGRVLLHLVARPFPRVKGSFRDVLLELERTRPFDEAFLVSGNDGSLALKVERFVSLSAIVPDLLLPKSGPKERGAFSSFGMAPAPSACWEKD